jgi:hypothetical protein
MHRRITRARFVPLLVAAVAVGIPALAEAPADGFVPLFAGADLAGGTTTGHWKPQPDGSLVIDPAPEQQGWKRFKDYLWTNRTYKDFVLDVEYRYPPGGNSGILFRVRDRDDPVKTGIEAQILDCSEKTGPMTHHDHGGILFAQGAAKNMSKTPGEWNRMIVSCRGNKIEVELNGEKIIDIMQDKTPIADRPLEGYIGLQDHGHPHRLEFRNIRIKELQN